MITVDNISQENLDKLVTKYSGKEGYTVRDEREEISFNEKREYFLFRFKNTDYENPKPEYCFIWIGKNLWQFSYINTSCNSLALWVNPTELLNSLLSD